MPLDINDFRDYKGGNAQKIRDSQKKRFASVEVVDEIIHLDETWRVELKTLDNLKKENADRSKQIGKLKKAKQDASELIALVSESKQVIAEKETMLKALRQEIDAKVTSVGNYVEDDVVVSNDEDKDNKIIRTFGEFASADGKLFHHELLYMIGGYEPEAGSKVAGQRGYYLTGPAVLLNQALINYGLKFLMDREFTPVQPPYFMNKSIMAETAQLSQFDEELYKLPTENVDEEDKYLIATSEQPISALHRGEWLTDDQLPKLYAGISTCFRKEAGSSGRNVWGIFRVHQFEKIEQFVITKPEDSSVYHEKMLEHSEEFLKSLGLSYRVVSIVSGHLNNAASKKYDVEAWFPCLQEFRELVSCSNCTDYQSRALEIRYGFKKMGEREKKYVHMLNSTLTATQRMLCCILENYQTEDGIKVPEVLLPFMFGMEKIPFVREKPINKQEQKRNKAL